jgi:hypothetical protein
MNNANKEHDDYFTRKLRQAAARAKEQRDKQLVEQQEIQSVQEKLQQQLLIMADLKAQIAVFQNADNSITTKSANTDNANTLSDDEERYKQTIVTNMIALIKQRK